MSALRVPGREELAWGWSGVRSLRKNGAGDVGFLPGVGAVSVDQGDLLISDRGFEIVDADVGVFVVSFLGQEASGEEAGEGEGEEGNENGTTHRGSLGRCFGGSLGEKG